MPITSISFPYSSLDMSCARATVCGNTDLTQVTQPDPKSSNYLRGMKLKAGSVGEFALYMWIDQLSDNTIAGFPLYVVPSPIFLHARPD